jgi:iron complex transport system permease protein
MHHPAQSHRSRAMFIIGTLLLCALASLLFAGTTGSIAVPLAEMPDALRQLARGAGSDGGSLAASLIELRASRALTAFVTGGA